MASKRLQLVIRHPSGDLTFDLEGEWFPSMERVHKEGSDPPELEEIREAWEFRGCRLVSPDGTAGALWTSIGTLRSRLMDRTNAPTSLEIVRDPAGVPVTELTLGPPDYERFQIDALEGDQDPDVPDASWVTTATFTIRASAVAKYADANGIVGFRQEVSVSYPNGFRVLEWRTHIETQEGVSAVEKAKTYARIPASSLGGDHSYDTNGPDGIDYSYTDADEVSGRTPTVVDAVSRIRQWGTTIGATSGQGSPSTFSLEIRVTTTPEGKVTTTSASAVGPNARQWVERHKPAGRLAESSETTTESGYAASWTVRSRVGAQRVDDIRVVVSPGERVELWRPIAGGFPPHVDIGAYGYWEAKVSIRSTAIGTELVDFPGPLPAPWRLQRHLTQESEAEVEGDRGVDKSQQVYGRSVELVYRSPVKPPERLPGGILEAIRNAPRIRSYLEA